MSARASIEMRQHFVAASTVDLTDADKESGRHVRRASIEMRQHFVAASTADLTAAGARTEKDRKGQDKISGFFLYLSRTA